MENKLMADELEKTEQSGDPQGRNEAVVIAEKRGYAKGYQAGIRRKQRENSANVAHVRFRTVAP